MGSCFSKCKRQKGKCMVCIYDCTSKVCKCSFMHKSCMKRYLKHNSNVCQICNTTFRTYNLDPAPTISKGEKEVLKALGEIHFRNIYKQHKDLQRWSNGMFPHITRFFQKYGLESKNVRISLENICDDDMNKSRFTQYLMDKGMKQEEIDEQLEIMSDVIDTYDVLHTHTKRMLKCNLSRLNYEFASDSDDIFVTI